MEEDAFVSPGRRLAAHLIDLVGVAAASLLVGFVCDGIAFCIVEFMEAPEDSIPQVMASYVFWVTCVVVPFFYYAVEGGALQGTPGKILMGLEVRRPDGYPVGLVASLARTSIKFILTFLPFAFLTIFVDKQKRLPQDFLGSQVGFRKDNGVISEYPGAPVSKRVLAFFIDLFFLFCMFVILMLIMALVAGITGDSESVSILGVGVIVLGIPAYFVLFECSSIGGTPGKRALGLGLSMHGGIGTIVRRHVLRASALLFPPLFLIPLLHSHNFALQDLTGAVVVEDGGEMPPYLAKMMKLIGWLGAVPAAILIPIMIFVKGKSPVTYREKNETVLTTEKPRSTSKFKTKNAEQIEYESDGMKLAAWIVKPKDGPERKPAILYAHGDASVGNDELALVAPLVKAGYLVMIPAWRGENGNPGNFEMCYGEVNDAHAALEYLAKRPDVDEDLLFAAGDGMGGTIVTLLAESTEKLQAATAYSAITDMTPPKKKPKKKKVAASASARRSGSRMHVVVVPTRRRGVKGAIIANLAILAAEAAFSKYSDQQTRQAIEELNKAPPPERKVGPYPDAPFKLEKNEIKHRSPVSYASFLNCPIMFMYAKSPERQVKMALLATEFFDKKKKKVSLEILECDENKGIKESVPKMLRYFDEIRKKENS